MTNKPLNFIEQIIEDDLSNGLSKSDLRFRFPPEPNGYLHIGHTKAIGISFGLGQKYGAPVNLRFDDTNPTKEDQEYVDAIKRDISWLGYQWDKECYSSDYFEQLFDFSDVPDDIRAKVDAETYGIQLENRLPLQQLFGGLPDIGPVLDKMAEDTRLRKARQDGRLPTDEATLAIDPTSDKPVAVQ